MISKHEPPRTQKKKKPSSEGAARKQGKRSPAGPKARGKQPLPKLTTIPGKYLLLGGVCALLAIVIAIYTCWPAKETPSGEQKRKVGPVGSIFDPPPSPQTAPRVPEEGSPSGRPAIVAVRLSPTQPTRLDTLKADVIPADPAQELVYTYRWKVNDKSIAGANENTLSLSNLKKRDLVSVVVTPYAEGKAGYPVESPVVAVHGVPPTLELQAAREAPKAGKAVELQLTSRYPDSDAVTFRLEAPQVAGMTIDGKTGRISWMIQPGQRGKISFGASVEDTDGTKVTKIFEVAVE
ncbi:MAG: hypothetical protein KBG09_03615 [Syntrophobacterales bacterium]|nr:hypothetical protein [Syntrophobacterales bacterium]